MDRCRLDLHVEPVADFQPSQHLVAQLGGHVLSSSGLFVTRILV